jgi:hypothetical protein
MLVEEMETATELFLVMELVKVRRWKGFFQILRLAVFLKDLVRKVLCYLITLIMYKHQF